METWGELMTRQEVEKAALQEGRTLAWERIRAEYPDIIPAQLMQQWRTEYGDSKLNDLENRHQSEQRSYFNQPQQQQEPSIVPKPQTMDDIQRSREEKRRLFQQEAQLILDQNLQRQKDRGRD